MSDILFFMTTGAATPPAAGGPGPLMTFLPLILIFVVFYFLLIRPQNKRMKDHRALLGSLAKNDTIVTSGGVIGKIVKPVKPEDVDLDVQIAEGVIVKIARYTVSEVRNRKPANDTGKAKA